MRVRTIISRSASFLGGAVVLFLVYRLLTAYTWRGGECAPPSSTVPVSPAVGPLHVMTFNIEGHGALIERDHIAEIAGVIREARPDIVGLQEVHEHTWQSRRHDQLSELAAATGMKPAFGPALQSLGGSFGNAVLVRGDVIDSRVHELPSFGEPRALLQATVRTEGSTIDVFVAHLAAWGKFSRKTRERQLTCILGIVTASPRAWLLMGDFNAGPKSSEMQALLSSGLVASAGDLRDGSHKITGERLDFIFTDPGWTIDSSAVLNVDPSDHRPVVARVRRRGK